MTPVERACERAMHRINEATNRSAGQHMRAIRKAYAQPVIEPEDDFISPMYEIEREEAMSAMTMLAYALVALALTGAAVTLAVAITLF